VVLASKKRGWRLLPLRKRNTAKKGINANSNSAHGQSKLMCCKY
jgi:hypothetical protein